MELTRSELTELVLSIAKENKVELDICEFITNDDNVSINISYIYDGTMSPFDFDKATSNAFEQFLGKVGTILGMSENEIDFNDDILDENDFDESELAMLMFDDTMDFEIEIDSKYLAIID